MTLIPTLENERRLFSKGYDCIAGIDEVGRGSWAGPLLAGVVIISKENINLARNIRIVRDSKTLSLKQRLLAYNFIKNNFEIAIGLINSAFLDSAGLTMANQQAMDNALSELDKKPDYILVDGRGFRFQTPNKNIIDGDTSVFCIAAASIVAKVVRDKIMDEYHRLYPEYFFNLHKGYGTKFHQEMLAKHGVCPIHRLSFLPVKKLLENENLRYNAYKHQTRNYCFNS